MNPRPLPPPTLATLYPPIRGYTYFEGGAVLPFNPNSDPQSSVNRWWLAEHGLLAYEEDAQVERILAQHGYRAYVFHDHATGTEAYAAIKDSYGVIAFRGTEVMTPGDSLLKFGAVARDWLTDANFKRVAFEDAGGVHAGFANALNAIWPALEPILAQASQWWCTGHSLGAGLATLAAVRLQRRGHTLSGLVTYGQPRSGDADFANVLNDLPFARVVNGCDVIPRLPPESFGFSHGGTLIHLDSEKLERYGTTLRDHLLALPAQLKHGIGALTPIELIDHAPLYYAIKCFNTAIG